jgi:hypothetical protein
MKDHEQAHNPASKQLESEGKNFLSPPAFSLNASPVDPPSDGSEGAAQFKKGDSNGAGGDASAGSGLPSDVRSQMEGSLGANFSGVKINANSSKATEMGALAFTQGEELHFAPGQFQPGSQQGQELIGHELAHVVQQREGRVKATGQEKGLAVNTDHSLESEADSMGAKAAAQLKAAESSSASVGSYTGGSGILQKAEDPTKPQLEAYKGVMVNQPGKISAPASQYGTAKSTGVNVRSKPDGNLPAIGKLRFNDGVQVIASDKTGAFYFVVGATGVTGWINKAFVAMGMPDYLADIYHITESDLTTILKNYYVDGGRWTLSTGNDYTTLATAVVVANQGRMGISVDFAAADAYRSEHSIKGALDPWMADNKAIYAASKIMAGTNIWLPSAGYIKMLQKSGVIGSRPGWINTAVEVGQGLAGFTIGMQAGIYGDLWSMLTGLWDMGKMIIDTIKSVLDGSLFSSIGDIFASIKEMTPEKALAMAMEVINMGKGAVNDFLSSWNAADMYNKWFFRGKILGTIVTEIVLAIVTAGASLGEQLIAKLGKYFPRLAKIGAKVLKAADKLDFKKSKKPGTELPNGPKKPNIDGPDANDMPEFDPKDSGSMDWALTFAKAKMITELNDEVDTPVGALVKILNATLATKSEAVTGYRSEALAEPGHYRIVQFTKKAPKAVDTDYSDKKARRNVNDHEGPGLGHTVERHVGKSDNWLKKRLRQNPSMEAASTFVNEAAANRAQGLFVKRNKKLIDNWLKSGASDLSMTVDLGMPLGNVLLQGQSKSFSSSKVFYLIRRSEATPHGWYFHTSFVVQ